MQGYFGSISIVCRTPFQRVVPDMTAVAIAYVNTGFVISADGFARWSDDATADDETRKAEREDAQKIFMANFKGQTIAYAITGLAANKNGTFDFRSVAHQAIDLGFKRTFATVKQAFEIVASNVNQSLESASRVA